MAEHVTPRRLTDLMPVKAAAWLLFALWIAGMSVFDTNACTSFPLVAGLGVVAALVLSGLSYGGRGVRLTWVNWVSVGIIGGYFLVRCLNSYAVAESWRESVLIVTGAVFYLAGVYAAQSRSIRPLCAALCLALVLNMAAFFLLRTGEIPIEWTGRPQWGFSGRNHLPVTLFMYKNFSGDFLCIGGLCAVGFALWGGAGLARKLVCTLLGLAAVALSFCCGTRGVYILLPVSAMVMWMLLVINHLFSESGKSVLIVLGSIVAFAALALGVYEFFAGGEAYTRLMSTDTHLRSMIWRCICDEAPNAPLWGFGVSAAHWGILNRFNEWATPNYAHNEYLQVWMDYGIIGVAAMAFIIVIHIICAFRRLAAESLPVPFRCLVSLSVLVLLGWGVCAIADFPWHHAALVGMTAFACGIMAAPYPHSRGGGDAALLVPVRAQGVWGRCSVALLCCATIAYAICMGGLLCKPWQQQWTYSDLVANQPENESRRLTLLEEVLHAYPDPAVMDQYYLIPLTHNDWPKQEELLKEALKGNPHQLYTATMLADVQTRQGKYAEAELTMRRYFVGDGMGRCLMMNWPAFYVNNLLEWGSAELKKGNTEKAYSLMDYGLNIIGRESFYLSFRLAYRDNAPWCKAASYRADVRSLEKRCAKDCALLKQLGVKKDDSWAQPSAACAKPALYSRWGFDDSLRKKIKPDSLKKPKKSEKKRN